MGIADEAIAFAFDQAASICLCLEESEQLKAQMKNIGQAGTDGTASSEGPISFDDPDVV